MDLATNGREALLQIAWRRLWPCLAAGKTQPSLPRLPDATRTGILVPRFTNFCRWRQATFGALPAKHQELTGSSKALAELEDACSCRTASRSCRSVPQLRSENATSAFSVPWSCGLLNSGSALFWMSQKQQGPITYAIADPVHRNVIFHSESASYVWKLHDAQRACLPCTGTANRTVSPQIWRPSADPQALDILMCLYAQSFAFARFPSLPMVTLICVVSHGQC